MEGKEEDIERCLSEILNIDDIDDEFDSSIENDEKSPNFISRVLSTDVCTFTMNTEGDPETNLKPDSQQLAESSKNNRSMTTKKIITDSTTTANVEESPSPKKVQEEVARNTLKEDIECILNEHHDQELMIKRQEECDQTVTALTGMQQERRRLKEQKFRLIQEYNALHDRSSSKDMIDGDTLSRKMETERMNTSIECIKQQIIEYERYTIRPLHRELNALKQHQQDLQWSLKDTASIQKKYDRYKHQLKHIKNRDTLHLDQLIVCYKQKIKDSDHELNLKVKNHDIVNQEVEQLRGALNRLVMDHKQMMQRGNYGFVDSSIEEIEEKTKRLQQQCHEMKMVELKWMESLRENMQTINIRKHRVKSEDCDLEKYLDSIRQIQRELQCVGLHCEGASHLISVVERSERNPLSELNECNDCNTMDAMNALNELDQEDNDSINEQCGDTRNYNGHFPQNQGKEVCNPMPPKPPAIALLRSKNTRDICRSESMDHSSTESKQLCSTSRSHKISEGLRERMDQWERRAMERS